MVSSNNKKRTRHHSGSSGSLDNEGPLPQECASVESTSSSLIKARALQSPPAKAQRKGDFESVDFWIQHETLLKDAWLEYGPKVPQLYNYETDNRTSTFHERFEQDYIDPKLRDVVNNLVQTSSRQTTGIGAEDKDVKNQAIFESTPYQIASGVYALPNLFTKKFCQDMVRELNHLNDAGIPVRRPNSMNRYGLILGEVPGLKANLDHVVQKYVIPFALHLFPESAILSDLVESYAFVVRYADGEDLDLAVHRDSSVITLNVCLGETFEGGNLGFESWDERDQFRYSHTLPPRNETVSFEPGMTILHRGAQMHEALPLKSGKRVNLIIWIHGKDGHVRYAPYEKDEQEHYSVAWTK
eukprot:CAMPEP_0198284092 /NCGR_PEP_ID=MMETSP1449-20131203/3608_1 /TAXON_ID=420275 /ORGANISM="Attheya septentrionalis, Strain CCMP2084" /LENGTH=355 /DNA_ID=CAMNT_0043981007 /DNA_START=2322 /DNA_END=3389 /DNA_ORIENTATION=-